MSVSNRDNDSEIQATESVESSNKVLIFPRRAPHRQLLRYSLSISLATVFLVALFINQIQLALVQKEIHVLAGERIADSNRIPANVRPEEVSAILKEQALASKIDSSVIKVIGSGKVKAIDQFIYGTLEGKYRPQIENGKIKNLQLSSNVSPADGQVSPDKVNFLMKSREFLGANIGSVALLEKGQGFEVFELQDMSKKTQGKVRFLLDEGGHISSIEIY
jgi:hypothetical protein